MKIHLVVPIPMMRMFRTDVNYKKIAEMASVIGMKIVTRAPKIVGIVSIILNVVMDIVRVVKTNTIVVEIVEAAPPILNAAMAPVRAERIRATAVLTAEDV